MGCLTSVADGNGGGRVLHEAAGRHRRGPRRQSPSRRGRREGVRALVGACAAPRRLRNRTDAAGCLEPDRRTRKGHRPVERRAPQCRAAVPQARPSGGFCRSTSRLAAPSWTPVRPETCLRRAPGSAACAGAPGSLGRGGTCRRPEHGRGGAEDHRGRAGPPRGVGRPGDGGRRRSRKEQPSRRGEGVPSSRPGRGNRGRDGTSQRFSALVRLRPVTAAVKALEDSLVIGDARAVVRKAGEQEELSPKAWKRLGRPCRASRRATCCR